MKKEKINAAIAALQNGNIVPMLRIGTTFPGDFGRLCAIHIRLERATLKYKASLPYMLFEERPFRTQETLNKRQFVTEESLEVAASVLKALLPNIVVGIQANFGEWLGYVGQAPISESGDFVKIATQERYYDETDESQSYTEYDGVCVPRHLYELCPSYWLGYRQ